MPQRWKGRAVLVLAAIATGCGGNGDSAPKDSAPKSNSQAAGEPFVEHDEAFALLRDAGLRLQRTRTRAASAARAEPGPVVSSRYADKSGAQFDLLVFPSPGAATRGAASLRQNRAAVATAQGANLVAAFPAAADADPVYAKVEDVLRRLEDECGRPDGDPRMRRACFSGAGAGDQPATMATRALPLGSTLRLGELTYTVKLSRRLNPTLRPDGRLADGSPPSRGSQWFAVFVRVCNDTHRPLSGLSSLSSAAGGTVYCPRSCRTVVCSLTCLAASLQVGACRGRARRLTS
jgi:hypothetical protein